MTWIREFAFTLFRPIPLVCWACVSLAAAFAGPFGTFTSMPIAERLMFWTMAVGLSIVLSLGIASFVAFQRPDLTSLRRDIAVLPAFSALYAPLLWHLIHLMSHDHGVPMTVLELFGVVLLISLSVALVREVLTRNRPELAPISIEDAPRLVERLPDEVRAPILSLSAQDHYVEVRTEKGETRLLLRFSDALDELDPADGLQVHRSHWVARAAVTGLRRDNGRLFLDLVDGNTIPVSRSFRDAVARAGWR